MNLRRRLLALDESFEGTLDKVAPSEGAKERLTWVAAAAVLIAIGLARAISGDPVIAVVLGSLAMALVVAGHLRYQRRRRERP